MKKSMIIFSYLERFTLPTGNLLNANIRRRIKNTHYMIASKPLLPNLLPVTSEPDQI